MPPSHDRSLEQDHRPPRSGTPAAWIALVLMAAMLIGAMFFQPILCGAIRFALITGCWVQGGRLSIQRVTQGEDGGLRAEGIEWFEGRGAHRSHITCDWMVLYPANFWAQVFAREKQRPVLFKDVHFGKIKLLLDRRVDMPDATQSRMGPYVRAHIDHAVFFPAACSGGPVDLVAISENARVAVNGLMLRLPHSWAGRISYKEATVDLDFWHGDLPAASAPATWDGTTLRIGGLSLGKELSLDEVELFTSGQRLNFGWRGAVGRGRLRGDGSFGQTEGVRNLEVTAVGENLNLPTLAGLMRGEGKKTAGTIHQARFTFRGDPGRPLEGDSSLRLVADDFRWEGLGWDSLRLAATLTGRTLTLSELKLRQKENEVIAEGRSKLPEDWRAALRAPFTATFQANLEDAGTLAALAGPQFGQLSGGLMLEGRINGAENKAEGYCNLEGTGMKIRSMPIDWMQGHLLFQGAKTRLVDLQALSGEDKVSLEGNLENTSPHGYKASAHLAVRNLTKRLSQLGITTATSIGGGAVKGTWNGEGSMLGNSGSFQADVTDWVSRWTTAGMSGSFEGTYTPEKLILNKAEFQQDDLKLTLRLNATTERLDIQDIAAVRGSKAKPLVDGGISLPVNSWELWESGDLMHTLDMGKPLSIHLGLNGIKAEELAPLLGQKIPFSGILDGTLTVSGTSETPDIHTGLNITSFVLKGSSETNDLALNVDSEKGRASGWLVQQPGASSPLQIKVGFPCHFTAENGSLRLSDAAAAVEAEANLHEISLDSWAALLGEDNWPLRGATLSGSLNLAGTVGNPSLSGKLRLAAREMVLPGRQVLSRLDIPIECALTSATIGEGTALYAGQPLRISGGIDWHGAQTELKLALGGKNLPLPEVGKLKGTGDTELQFGLRKGEAPTLKGSVTIRSISGELQDELTPSFSPPGMPVHGGGGSETVEMPGIFSNTMLDLLVNTAGNMLQPTSVSGAHRTGSDDFPAQLQAELHLQGSMRDPRFVGGITARNATLILPAGSFFIPEAKVRLQDDGGKNLSARAYGLTRRGICALDLSGSTREINPRLEGPVGVLLPDMILALTEPLRVGFSSATLEQGFAWIRQQKLLPLPAKAWIEAELGENNLMSLGFYGRPWCWMRGSGEPTLLKP